MTVFFKALSNIFQQRPSLKTDPYWENSNVVCVTTSQTAKQGLALEFSESKMLMEKQVLWLLLRKWY